MTRYAGGKYRLGKHIAASMRDYEVKYDAKNGIDEDRPYFEPFVGMCGVMRHVSNKRKRIGCDLNLDVIAMWKSLQNGWEPPSEITEEMYNHLRDNVQEGDPSRGIVAHGASWGGYYFSKYMPGIYPGCRRNVMKFFPLVKDVEFKEGCCYTNFLDLEGYTIYCDSPYANSIGATGKKSRFLNRFDHDGFWENMRVLSKNNLLFVSESVAPDDFKIIWEKETLSRMAGKGVEKRRVRTERLYVHESQFIESSNGLN